MVLAMSHRHAINKTIGYKTIIPIK
jgi:hypothetical protein